MMALTKLKTLHALGIGNVARVASYRLRLRLGIHPVQRISASVPTGPFFSLPATARLTGLPVNRQWLHQQCFFGWFTVPSSDCPAWLTNPFNGKSFPAADQPWWKIADFSQNVGDIKTVWEASRSDWMLGFAQQACQGDGSALDTLNAWLTDWVTKNPPYSGPNWKCGQEASIRVMHLAMAALLLEQADEPELALARLVTAHLQRIAPTIGYAIAQDNNHGTSEAAALFIGGDWLARQGDKRGKAWSMAGRRWLENRARHLIEPDGSFSQQSVNYHRVMLDTYCMAEGWRCKLALPTFSPTLQARLAKATTWLHAVVNPEIGDAPNLGANDGARLLPLTDTDYRDYRPTVQVAMALFQNSRAYPMEGSWSLPLRWLDIPVPEAPAALSTSRSFPDGGYCTLVHEQAFVLFRYPRFRFRPGHADALHLDFSLNGENMLRGGGSYSYADDTAMQYFKGTASHNTIQFDDRDQMPRLGRFLFGAWLQAEDVKNVETTGDESTTRAGYRDWLGARHHRLVSLKPGTLLVQDKISGFQKQAILRWRLKPGKWTLKDNHISDGTITITLSADIPIQRIQLVEGLESRYYLQQTALPVLEVEVREPGKLVSTIEWD